MVFKCYSYTKIKLKSPLISSPQTEANDSHDYD